MVRLPSSDELGSAPTSVLQQTFRWSGPVSILERRDNIYASSSPSKIVTCELKPGCTVRVWCKYGELVVARQNHLAGTAGEEVVYRQVLEPLAIGKPAFFGSYSNRTSGETWLFLEYLERGERLTKVGEREQVCPQRRSGSVAFTPRLRSGLVQTQDVARDWRT